MTPIQTILEHVINTILKPASARQIFRERSQKLRAVQKTISPTLPYKTPEKKDRMHHIRRFRLSHTTN